MSLAVLSTAIIPERALPMRIPTSVRSKHYPGFIRKSKVLAKYQGQERIWPKIGLDNCTEKRKDGKRGSIVFSGSGNAAMWDIATMSMRGISSCQTWGSYHAKHLIGSMADPYMGIIYMANRGNTSKGPRMSRRAVVRFVLNNKTGKPAILLERVYGVRYDGGSWRQHQAKIAEARREFASFLRGKTRGALPIISGAAGYRIPLTGATRLIGDDKKSYRDSGINYRRFPKFSVVSKVKIDLAKEAAKTAKATKKTVKGKKR
jgi:hypothetical protein